MLNESRKIFISKWKKNWHFNQIFRSERTQYSRDATVRHPKNIY